MYFHIKDQALLQTLEEIAASYALLKPDEYKATVDCARRASDTLAKPTGMSVGGNFMSVAEIPTDVYSFVKWQMKKRHGIDDFFRDERNTRLLLRVFEDFQVKRKPTPLPAKPTA